MGLGSLSLSWAQLPRVITSRLEGSRVQGFGLRDLPHGIERGSIVSGLEWQARGPEGVVHWQGSGLECLKHCVGEGWEENQTNNFETQGKWLQINDAIQKC